jgi:hypothetical protein
MHAVARLCVRYSAPSIDNNLSPYIFRMDEACATLAGPWAEVSLANGNLYGSVSEIIEVGFLASRAAELLGKDRCQVLAEILERTAGLVEGFRYEIVDLAARLEKRKRITRDDRPVKRILERIRAVPVANLQKASENAIDTLTRLMGNATSGLDDLIAQVTARGAAQ